MRLRRIGRVGIFIATALVAACSPANVRAPFTAATLEHAEVAGYSNIRVFLDAPVEDILSRQDMFVPNTGAHRTTYLALSSGGEGGAYGAGYLNGWTARGDRPNFDVVTGVSAGALIAPFAFVGSSADARLAAFFQDGLATQLDRRNSLLQGALGQSLYPASPLVTLIKNQIDDALIDQVAARHREGARLLVLTTNLDAGRGVIWNLGTIAASGQPDRYDLFRNVVRASASIPVFFPPTEITSQSGGVALSELHVDGAVTRQILFLPDVAYDDVIARDLLPSPASQLYIIANQQLSPDFQMVTDRTLALGRRAYSMVIRAATIEALIADGELARSSNAEFRMTSIPDITGARSNEPFDSAFMESAFSAGMANGRNGEWFFSADSIQN